MSFPDYGKSVTQVGTWIADALAIVPGHNIFLEPSLPQAPDCVVAIFEIGGTWNEERNTQDWTLLLVVRAATLREARATAISALRGAVDRWRASPPASRENIRGLRISRLPQLMERDERGRVHLEAQFIMSVNAAGEFGVVQ